MGSSRDFSGSYARVPTETTEDVEAQLAALVTSGTARADGVPAASIRAAGAGDGRRFIYPHPLTLIPGEITVQRGPLRTLAALGITLPEVM